MNETMENPEQLEQIVKDESQMDEIKRKDEHVLVVGTGTYPIGSFEEAIELNHAYVSSGGQSGARLLDMAPVFETRLPELQVYIQEDGLLGPEIFFSLVIAAEHKFTVGPDGQIIKKGKKQQHDKTLRRIKDGLPLVKPGTSFGSQTLGAYGTYTWTNRTGIENAKPRPETEKTMVIEGQLNANKLAMIMSVCPEDITAHNNEIATLYENRKKELEAAAELRAFYEKWGKEEHDVPTEKRNLTVVASTNTSRGRYGLPLPRSERSTEAARHAQRFIAVDTEGGPALPYYNPEDTSHAFPILTFVEDGRKSYVAVIPELVVTSNGPQLKMNVIDFKHIFTAEVSEDIDTGEQFPDPVKMITNSVQARSFRVKPLDAKISAQYANELLALSNRLKSGTTNEQSPQLLEELDRTPLKGGPEVGEKLIFPLTMTAKKSTLQGGSTSLETDDSKFNAAGYYRVHTGKASSRHHHYVTGYYCRKPVPSETETPEALKTYLEKIVGRNYELKEANSGDLGTLGVVISPGSLSYNKGEHLRFAIELAPGATKEHIGRLIGKQGVHINQLKDALADLMEVPRDSVNIDIRS